MGYQELIAALRAEGEARVRERMDAARRDAAGIREEARRQVEVLREESRRRLAREAEETRERILGHAGRESEKIRLLAIEDAAASLRREAERLLVQRAGSAKVFEALLREAVEAVSAAEVEVRVPPSMAKESTRLLARWKRTARVAPDPDCGAGVEVRAEGGRQIVQNTAEGRLDKAWTRVVPEIIRKLEETANVRMGEEA